MQLVLLRFVTPLLIVVGLVYYVNEYIENKNDTIIKLTLSVELLEVENKALSNFRKGFCDDKKIKKDINDSTNDANGTKYNWVFLKAE